MKKLVFARPKKGGIVKEMDKDVRIWISRHKGGDDQVLIIFERGIENLISNTDYGTVAVQDNRMYFTGCQRSEGWKISMPKGKDDKPTQARARLMMTMKNLSEDMQEFIRISNDMQFELKFDDAYGLYYIEHPMLDFQRPSKKGPGRPRKY